MTLKAQEIRTDDVNLDRCWKLIYSALRKRYKTKEDAEDAAQDTFARWWKAKTSGATPRNDVQYLWATSRAVAIDRHRYETRDCEPFVTEMPAEWEAADGDGGWPEVDLYLDLSRAFGSLSDKSQELIHFLARGYTLQAAADEIGVSVTAIKNRLKRIRGQVSYDAGGVMAA